MKNFNNKIFNKYMEKALLFSMVVAIPLFSFLTFFSCSQQIKSVDIQDLKAYSTYMALPENRERAYYLDEESRFYKDSIDFFMMKKLLPYTNTKYDKKNINPDLYLTYSRVYLPNIKSIPILRVINKNSQIIKEYSYKHDFMPMYSGLGYGGHVKAVPDFFDTVYSVKNNAIVLFKEGDYAETYDIQLSKRKVQGCIVEGAVSAVSDFKPELSENKNNYFMEFDGIVKYKVNTDVMRELVAFKQQGYMIEMKFDMHYIWQYPPIIGGKIKGQSKKFKDYLLIICSIDTFPENLIKDGLIDPDINKNLESTDLNIVVIKTVIDKITEIRKKPYKEILFFMVSGSKVGYSGSHFLAKDLSAVNSLDDPGIGLFDKFLFYPELLNVSVSRYDSIFFRQNNIEVINIMADSSISELTINGFPHYPAFVSQSQKMIERFAKLAKKNNVSLVQDNKNTVLAHSAFLDRQIDAVTIRIPVKKEFKNYDDKDLISMNSMITIIEEYIKNYGFKIIYDRERYIVKTTNYILLLIILIIIGLQLKRKFEDMKPSKRTDTFLHFLHRYKNDNKL